MSTWQWHVHGWFCWFDAVRAVFTSLVGRPGFGVGSCTASRVLAPGSFLRPLASGSHLFDVLPKFKYADFSGRSLPETFPYSALFGSTANTGLCQSTEVSPGFGLCFAKETGTHSVNCATSCLDMDVDLPVVVLDRCLVSTCRKLWSPAVAVRRPGRVVSVWQQKHLRTVQLCSLQLPRVVCSGQAEGYFLWPAHRCRAEGSHVNRDTAPGIWCI